jgi:hypothetical protein
MWVVIGDSVYSIGDYVRGWGFEILHCVQDDGQKVQDNGQKVQYGSCPSVQRSILFKLCTSTP